MLLELLKPDMGFIPWACCDESPSFAASSHHGGGMLVLLCVVICLLPIRYRVVLMHLLLPRSSRCRRHRCAATIPQADAAAMPQPGEIIYLHASPPCQQLSPNNRKKKAVNNGDFKDVAELIIRLDVHFATVEEVPQVCNGMANPAG